MDCSIETFVLKCTCILMINTVNLIVDMVVLTCVNVENLKVLIYTPLLLIGIFCVFPLLMLICQLYVLIE